MSNCSLYYNPNPGCAFYDIISSTFSSTQVWSREVECRRSTLTFEGEHLKKKEGGGKTHFGSYKCHWGVSTISKSPLA